MQYLTVQERDVLRNWTTKSRWSFPTPEEKALLVKLLDLTEPKKKKSAKKRDLAFEGVYENILRFAERLGEPFVWSAMDPKSEQPEGDGGECCWKRCGELADAGFLLRVMENGEQMRRPGIHPGRGGKLSPNQVFEISEAGRALVRENSPHAV